MDIRVSNYGNVILHHSRIQSYREPHGAVTTGSSVRLRLSIAEGFPDVTCMCTYWIDGAETLVEMQRADVTGALGRRWYEASIMMPGHTCVVWYSFIINDGMRLIYYGSVSGGGRGEVYDCAPPSFQITVYDASFQTPDWFKNATMYQVFVDRFHKGGGAFERAKEHEKLGRRIVKHESWDEQPTYRPEPGEEFYAPNDYYGGDLRGVIEKLPYIKSLGTTVLYLNPIFESPSNHKYDTGDYHKVDPMYGTQDDLRELCDKAEMLGIRVMLDGVFSHTGSDSRYFNREGRYDSLGAYQSVDSPYYSWYTFFHFPEKYASWWGFQSLPEVRELDERYREFIMRGPSSVIARWADAGVKGWRLDVADELPEEFIAEFRARLKETDPQSVLLGEVWEDASTKESMGVKRQYVMGKELDSVMNYPFRAAVLDFFLGRADAHGLNNSLSRLRENYPEPFYLCAMNLISSHDVPRALSLLSGAPDKDMGLSREEQAQYTLTRGQLSLGISRIKLAALLQSVIPGVASTYYGDEAGVTGLMDPFNRGTYPWGNENAELLEHYRFLAQLRSSHPYIRFGGMVMGAPENNVIAIVRFSGGTSGMEWDDGERICVVLINRSLAGVRVPLRFEMLVEGPDAEKLAMMNVSGRYRDMLSGAEYMCAGTEMELGLPSLSAMVLVKQQ